jgi:hypothetical protein
MMSQPRAVMTTTTMMMMFQFILIHIDADDDCIPLRMTMLSMKKTSDDL